jgi:hypothetical protein
MNLSQCVNWRSRNDVMGHFRPIDNVYAMSAYPPTAVELSQRSEPPLRAKSDRCTVANNVVIRSRRRRGPDRARARQGAGQTDGHSYRKTASRRFLRNPIKCCDQAAAREAERLFVLR